jgi:hypothetical protein
MTLKEWIEFMGANPSFNKGKNFPVENVSWLDTQEFIQKDHKFSNLFSRFLPWLIGQNSISTSDCWWILLSLPLKNETDSSQVKESAILLIDAWKSLKNKNFPREFIAD